MKMKIYKRVKINSAADIREVQEYIDLVRYGEYPSCKEQLQLMDYVEKCIKEEDLYISYEQVKDYLGLEKYFPFDLFEWEKFLFILHNCIYRKDGILRWSDIFCLVGRGTGKNGYLGFEDFALLSPYNTVNKYHITICANSESQATTSFYDVYDVLEDNKQKLSKWYEWNKETIKCTKTGSELCFATSNPSTKDGGRQGMICFDELHQYQDYKIINVFTSGLGKKQDPRRTFITTNGYVREGPLDDLLETAKEILDGVVEDNGLLPFICKLDDKKEIDDPIMWHKANPSLRFLPHLQEEIKKEYVTYKKNPISNPDFVVKRMNIAKSQNEDKEVTSWENILATNQPIPELKGATCYGAVDYAKTTDFVTAGLLFRYNNCLVWITHTWVCSKSKDLPRIKAPLREWEELGLLTFVDEDEISPDIVADWFLINGQIYNITKLFVDNYRWTLLKKAFKEAGFDTDKKGRNNVTLIRPSDIMLAYPIINSAFTNKTIIWGDNPLMRWFCNNTCLHQEKYENYTFAKIEPKSRKTDGFMAFVAGVCGDTKKELPDCKECDLDFDDFGVYTY